MEEVISSVININIFFYKPDQTQSDLVRCYARIALFFQRSTTSRWVASLM